MLEPHQGGSCVYPNQSGWKEPLLELTEGPKLISGSLVPSQACHLGCTSPGSL